MSFSVDAAATGSAELVFARRGGRTALVRSHVSAPMTVVRPFPIAAGGQLVQLITLGPGLCGGDAVRIRITAEAGANVVVTTTAATRVLSMRPGRHAEQHVRIDAHDAATVQYYPLVTIPFPDSEFTQTLTVDAAADSRVGVVELWALGRTARDEYLRFRALSSRTTLHVGGVLHYADAIELRPREHDLTGVGVLAGRRYLGSGFWHGATIAEERREGAGAGAVLVTLGQSRPNLAYLRLLAHDGPALESAVAGAAARVAWAEPPLSLARFRC